MGNLKKAKLTSKILLLMIKRMLWLPFLGIQREILLRSWFGRLGNNLLQIAHFHYLCSALNLSGKLPKHKLLLIDPDSQHDIPSREQNNDGALYGPYQVFIRDLLNADYEEYAHLNNKMRSFFYQYDVFPLKPSATQYRQILKSVHHIIPRSNETKLSANTLVIHMRSGDVFSEKYCHPGYVQPPLSFYKKLVRDFDFSKIIVVTQPDRKNPCIHALLELMPDITIQTSDIQHDIGTILSAENLVSSFSSFPLTLGFASHNLKRLFVPQFEVRKGYVRTRVWPPLLKYCFISGSKFPGKKELDFQLHTTQFKNYMSIGDWRNTQGQRDLMLDHAVEDVCVENLVCD